MTDTFLPYTSWLDMSLPPAIWLIPDLLERGSGGFLHGQAGAYKSFLLLQLALDVASGSTVLNIWAKQPPRSVMLFQAEGTKRAWQARIRAHRATYPEDIPFFTEHRLDLKVDSAKGQKIMWEAINRIRPDLVILDPLKNLMTGTDGDPIAIERWFDQWNSWRQEFGCSVLVGTHDRQPQHHYDRAKGMMVTSNYGWEELRGRTELPGWADLIMALKKRDNVATLIVQKVRDGIGDDEYRFRLEDGRLLVFGRSDGVDMWIGEHLQPAPLVSELVKDTAEATGMSTKTVRRHIDMMVGAGTVEKFIDGEGKTRIQKGA